MREDPAGGWHHVYNRGIRETPIFLDDQHRLTFLRVLADAAATHGVIVHGFCLVGNHYHLLVSCPEAGISDLMHDTAGRYASWFNRRNDLFGPLCQGRFESRLLETDEEVLIIAAYVHRNALDITPGLPLEDYRWSSAGQYLERTTRRPDLAVDTEEVLALAGSSRQYWRLMATDVPALDELRRQRASEVATERLNEICARVGIHYTCPVAHVRNGGRSHQARPAALLSAVADGVPRDAIAAYFGYSSVRSLNTALARLRTQPATHAVWAAVHSVGAALSATSSKAA